MAEPPQSDEADGRYQIAGRDSECVREGRERRKSVSIYPVFSFFT